VPSDGGFLLQPEFSSRLIQEVFDTGIISSMVTTIPMTRTSLKVNGVDETSRATGSRYGGIRGYWADEASEKTASKPKFRQIELNLRKMIGLCYATDELLEDVGALESIITNGFRDEFAFLTDDAIINGTGAGQPLGIMNAGCTVTQDKEAGQAATTVVYENILNMWTRLFARSWPNAVWLININVLPQLAQMAIKFSGSTNGAPVYVPPGGASVAPYGTLLGRPVYAIEHCQTLGTEGDLVLADFRNGYLLGRKGAMASDMSIHVRFVYDESVFRFVIRIDGQPVLASPVTPYKGGSSYTQSHFVTLQTRS
jgi:HK97 family phage major capsid protein